MNTIQIQLTISGPVVTLYTITFKIKRCYSTLFCLQLRINREYPPKKQKLIPFITQTECVYCAVRIELWIHMYNTGKDGLSSLGSGFDLTRDLWPTKWHRDRYLEYRCFLLSVPFHQCSILIFVYMFVVPQRQTGKAWPSKKRFSFGNQGILDKQVPSLGLSSVELTSALLPVEYAL